MIEKTNTSQHHNESPRLSLPLVDATRPHNNFIKKYASEDVFIADSDVGKRALINAAKTFMEKMDSFSDTEINNMEFEWLTASSETPIILTRADIVLPTLRSKRISFADKSRDIKEHIKQYCAEEIQIFHSSGLSEGKLLIFKAQRAENPFRILYDDIDGYDPPAIITNISSGANYFLNFITIGIKPLLGNLIANYYRKKYYDKLGDKICSTRQVRLSVAQIATALDIDNGVRFGISSSRPHKSTEFENMIPFRSRADYYARNKNSETELFINAKWTNRDNIDENVVVKYKGTDEIEMSLPPQGTSEGMKKNVVFDENVNVWRDKHSSEVVPFKVSLAEGENIIRIRDDVFPLRVNNDNLYEIVVRFYYGGEASFPVYMEPLSKTWHLSNANGRSVFTNLQQRFLNRIKVNQESRFKYNAIYNQNPEVYSNGLIYEVRTLHDNIATTPSLFHVVEMNGWLLPVRMTQHGRHGIRYDIFDIKHPMQKSYPIEWDGDRWILEKWTSPHISQALAKHITPDMYIAELPVGQLSPPDQNGFKWIGERSYLKIRNKYVEVFQDEQFHIFSASGRTLSIKHVNQQFYPMTPKELEFKIKNDEKRRRIDDYYKELKKQLSNAIMDNSSFLDIVHMTNAFFSPTQVQVVPVASTTLDRKRFLVFIPGEPVVIETTRLGDDIFMLRGNVSALALEKYNNKFFDENMRFVATLRRDNREYEIIPGSRTQIDIFARELIRYGAELIDGTLNELETNERNKKIMLVAHDDFFETSLFENNVFSSMKNAYQVLRDSFISISEKYPEAIIIPGSVYVSEDVLDEIRHQGLIYQQGGKNRHVDDAINFSAIVVPIFHRGKCIAIARKGEFMTMHANNSEEHVRIDNLDVQLTPSSILKIHNIRDDVSADEGDSSEVRTGTIFVGKTLFTNEATFAKKLFLPNHEHQENSVDQFFSNEFMIDNDKFLLIIGDEFQRHGEDKSLVRSMAYPQAEDVNQGNHYDWVIHLSGGMELDNVMRSAGDNYLQVDRFAGGKCVSEYKQRICFTSYSEEKKISLYEFVSD